MRTSAPVSPFDAHEISIWLRAGLGDTETARSAPATIGCCSPYRRDALMRSRPAPQRFVFPVRLSLAAPLARRLRNRPLFRPGNACRSRAAPAATNGMAALVPLKLAKSALLPNAERTRTP